MSRPDYPQTKKQRNAVTGTGYKPAPYVFKSHFVLPVWEALETGYKPVSARKFVILY